MPRLRFEDEKDFIKSVVKLASKVSNFVCFNSGEDLVIYPTVSTRPSFVMYLNHKPTSELLSTIHDMGIDILKVDKIDWDTEKTLQSPQ
jgi:hypothetical protein